MARDVALLLTPSGIRRYVPTSLAALGRDETYLEGVIADEPGILGLESKSSGIYGPFQAFRQTTFATPQGRSIRPDIVFLSASGHPVVVEVKLLSNPELRDRRVIAQVVDYASAFAAMDEQGLLSVFRGSSTDIDSWPALMARLFPDEEPEELAHEFVRRFSTGEIKLIIACDQAPVGLRETVESVTILNAMAFELSVVEVRPYSVEGDENVLFLAQPRVETEIVARTSVTVTYEAGVARPGVSVTVDSPRKVEEAVRESQSGLGRRKRNTVVDAAIPLVDERLTDLVGQKRVRPAFGWKGFAIGTELHIEDIGRGHFGVGFRDLARDATTRDDGRIYVSIFANKKSSHERLVALARDRVGAEMKALEGQEDVGTNWITWNFARPIPPETEWTPESIADYVARWFRLLADRLPVRAAD